MKVLAALGLERWDISSNKNLLKNKIYYYTIGHTVQLPESLSFLIWTRDCTNLKENVHLQVYCDCMTNAQYLKNIPQKPAQFQGRTSGNSAPSGSFSVTPGPQK